MNDNNGLYFVVGALVVVVGIGAFVMFGHHRDHEMRSGGGGATTIERTVTHEPDGDRTVITREHEHDR